MKRFNQIILSVIALSLTATWVACSSGSSTTTTPPPAITVAFSPAAPTTLATSATQSLTAVVTNDSTNAGVTWTVTCDSAGACGSFAPTSTPSGTATVYTAPSAVPTANTVTVTATSVKDATKSASATITITAASSPITVTLTPAPPTSLAENGASSVTAVVANDSANAGVTWTVNCGSTGACGGYSATSTASGTATTFTAPSAIPTGNTVTVTATSVTDNTKSASATIKVTVANTLADGNYVFFVTGQDIAGASVVTGGNSPFYSVAGTFTVASGAITTGEQDFADEKTATRKNTISSGTVTTTANGNVQVTLNTGDAAIGPAGNGIETLNIAMVSSTKGLINEFDASATGSGELELQTSTTMPQGSYAFVVSGGNSAGAFASYGGVINEDGAGTISGTGSVIDIDDAGSLHSPLTLNASTVSAADSFGRVQISLSINGAPGIGLAGYVVDGKRILAAENNADPNDFFFGVMGGVFLSQGTNTGTFSATSVEGSSFVFGLNGEDTNGHLQLAGVLTFGADGSSITGFLNFNDLTCTCILTSPQAPFAITGSYTVDATGRVTLLNLADRAVVVHYNAQLYLDGSGQATMMTLDGLDEAAGPAFLQTGGGSFTASSFSGGYGVGTTGSDLTGAELDAVGPVTSDGVSALTGTADLNLMGTTATTTTSGVALTGTYTSAATGIFTGTITGLDVTTAANADAFVYYVVDTTKVIAIEADANQETLSYFVLQQ